MSGRVPLEELERAAPGVLGGLGTICTAGGIWLVGWQKYEQRRADPRYDEAD